MSAQAMIFPQTQIGLPREVQYDLPPQLPDSARSYSAHISPDGATSVLGSIINTTTATANSAGLINQAFSSQQISFTIPSGQSPSTFLDTDATSLSFRLTWTVTTAASYTNGYSQLIGGASSFFDSLQLVSNNTPIESISQYGQLANMAITSLCNYAERYGSLTFAGLDTNGTSGIDMPTAVGTYYINFCIPLMSIIGQNNSSGKLLPIGMIQNLQLIMTTSALLPVVNTCTAVATVPVYGTTAATAPQLDQFSLNLKYVDLGTNAVLNSAKGGKLYMKANTYTNSNATIPSGTLGASSVLLQIRNSSLKSLFFYQALPGQTGVVPNGTYDAVNNGSLTKAQVVIGGNRFPNRELNPSIRPAEALHVLQSAWGLAGDWAKFGGVLSRESFGATVPSIVSGGDQSLVVPSNTSRAGASGSDSGTLYVAKFPSQHFLGVDLEKSSGVLFQGVNTRPSPPFVEITTGVATTASSTMYGFGLSDVVLEIDVASKSVVAYI